MVIQVQMMKINFEFIFFSNVNMLHSYKSWAEEGVLHQFHQWGGGGGGG